MRGFLGFFAGKVGTCNLQHSHVNMPYEISRDNPSHKTFYGTPRVDFDPVVKLWICRDRCDYVCFC